MNSVELHKIHLADQAKADASREAWHAALIAESPFRRNDRVVIPGGDTGTIVTIDPEETPYMYLVMYDSDCPHGWWAADSLQRIDESGNVLPPREPDAIS